jgi:hypothetical protein
MKFSISQPKCPRTSNVLDVHVIRRLSSVIVTHPVTQVLIDFTNAGDVGIEETTLSFLGGKGLRESFASGFDLKAS